MMLENFDLEPLRYPDEWPSPSKLELLCRWVPFVGWGVGAILEQLRTRPIEDALYQQFKTRPVHPIDYWDDEFHRRIANSLIESCVQACCWPHSHFIPDDSLGVMMEFRTGDGSEWDAMFRIEKALGIQLDNADWQKLCEQTLQDAVEHLARRIDLSRTQ